MTERAPRSDEGQKGETWGPSSPAQKRVDKERAYSSDTQMDSAVKVNNLWSFLSWIWSWFPFSCGTPVAPTKTQPGKSEKGSKRGQKKASIPPTETEHTYTVYTAPARLETLKSVETARVKPVVSVDEIDVLESRVQKAFEDKQKGEIVACLEEIHSEYKSLGTLMRDPTTPNLQRIVIYARSERLEKIEKQIEEQIFGIEYLALKEELSERTPDILRLCLLIPEVEKRIKTLKEFELFGTIISERIEELNNLKDRALEAIAAQKERLKQEIDRKIKPVNHKKLEQMALSLGLSRVEGETFGMLARRIRDEIVKHGELKQEEKRLQKLVEQAHMHYVGQNALSTLVNIIQWERVYMRYQGDLERNLVVKEVEAEVFGF